MNITIKIHKHNNKNSLFTKLNRNVQNIKHIHIYIYIYMFNDKNGNKTI